MPSSKTKQKDEFVMRSVPPGNLNKDKYYLILGNLPFENDWRGLKTWLDTELQARAPRGKEHKYKLEYTSALRLGTGWARVRGLDVFDAAVSITTNVPYLGRNLMVYDNNRDDWVQIMDSAYRQEKKLSQSTESPVDGQPNWTFDPESSWEKYGGQYQQPTGSMMGYPQHQDPALSSGYYSANGSYPIGAAQVSYSATLPQTDEAEWGYTTSQQYWGGQAPSTTAVAYNATGCSDAFTYSTNGAGDAFVSPPQGPLSPTPSQLVPTEQRQVMIRNIPIKTCSSSASRRRDKPRSVEEVRQWITDAVLSTGYGPGDMDRVDVGHKHNDPGTLKGYAVLHMANSAAADYMTKVLHGTDYDGRQLTAELGKEATTLNGYAGIATSNEPTGGKGRSHKSKSSSGGGNHHGNKNHDSTRNNNYNYNYDSKTSGQYADTSPLVVSGSSSVLPYRTGGSMGTQKRVQNEGETEKVPNKHLIAMGSNKDKGKKKK